MTIDSENYKIVFASHTVMGATFVVGSHHLARQCAERGHDVLHISTPITPAHLCRLGNDATVRHRFKIWASGGESSRLGLAQTVPMTLLPWKIAGPIFGATGWNSFLWTLPSYARSLRKFRIEMPDVLICDAPCFAGLDGIVNARKMIYRVTDLYSAMRGQRTVDDAEEALLSRADGLVATAEPLLSRLRIGFRDRPSLLLENGVEHQHFSTPRGPPPEYATIAPPRAIYVGAFDERFDAAAIRRLADGEPRLNIVLIGPMSPRVREILGSRKNIFILGARPYRDLPGYLQHADVALLPLSDHGANESRSPMKLYEYQAAGLPVVARASVELTRRQEPYVTFYEASGDLAAAASAVLQNIDSAGGARRDQISDFAKRFDWIAKTDALLAFVAGLLADDRAGTDAARSVPPRA